MIATRKIVVFAVATLALAFSSCRNQQLSAQKASEADSLINAAFDAMDYNRIITLCDSLEQRGDISLYKATRFRSEAYVHLSNLRTAEEELRKGMERKPSTHQDSIDYCELEYKLASVLYQKQDYDGILTISIQAIEDFKKLGVEKSDLTGYLCEFVGSAQYSLGMKQKLGIANAVMGEPDIIMLDEPINALDEESVKKIRVMLRELRDKGKLLIIACHDREEIEYLSDEIILMHEGRIVGREKIEHEND